VGVAGFSGLGDNAASPVPPPQSGRAQFLVEGIPSDGKRMLVTSNFQNVSAAWPVRASPVASA